MEPFKTEGELVAALTAIYDRLPDGVPFNMRSAAGVVASLNAAILAGSAFAMLNHLQAFGDSEMRRLKALLQTRN